MILPKERRAKILLILGLGIVFGVVLIIISLTVVYYFRVEKKTLTQNWFSYYFSDAIHQPEKFLVLFGSILLCMAIFTIIFLWQEIGVKSRENRELEEKNKNEVEFTSAMANQLRLPLSNLRHSFLGLQGGLFGRLNKKQASVIQDNLKEVLMSLNLINNIIDVSRVELQKMMIKADLIALNELNELIKDSVKVYLRMFKDKNISFNYRFSKKDTPFYVYISWPRIKQVIMILLENALNFTPFGGKIDFTIYLREKDLMFFISDTGIGIPQEEKKNIFKKLYRASNAKKLIRGVGINLYLAKSLVNLNKGKIWFDSKKDKGTIFYFTLPIRGEAEEFLTRV